jgi:glutathione peroxidase
MTDAIKQDFRPDNEPSVYDFSALSVDGQDVPLSRYRGKVLVIVNTASKCGFTPQYAGLEALYEQYKDRVEVLGFPCNQFGGQEPGTAADIAQFCELNYGVSFPIFARIDVNGPEAHPLYKFLKRERSGLLGALGFGAIKWNFTKFLVDREGSVVSRYAPTTTPAELAPAIDKLL